MIATTLETSTSTGTATPRTKRNFWDGRLFLKVKLKSLAAESRIIRGLERKEMVFRNVLWSHRTGVVRDEARATLLAYGFIRGRSYAQMEGGTKAKPDWKKVEAMVKKYGAIHKWENATYQERLKVDNDMLARFQTWKEESLTAKKE